MTRFGNILIVFLTFLMPTVCSCSDDFFDVDPTEPGAVTIKMGCSVLQVASRADIDDPEFAIKGVKLYFYAADSEGEMPTDQPAVAVKEKDASSFEYISRTVTVKLSDDEIAAAFPNEATECYVYAVANLDNSNVTVGDIPKNPTYEQIMQTTLENATSLNETQTSFVMSGLGTVKLDRTTTTMSTTDAITLKRALSKITLTVNVATSFTDGEGDNMVEYEPLTDKSAIVVQLNNCATSGWIETLGDSDDQKYNSSYKNNFTKLEDTIGKDIITGYETDTDGTLTEIKENIKYYQFTIDVPFYTYATNWASNNTGNDTSLTLTVPWKAKGGNDYVTYYYQIPINREGQIIDRNKHYQIIVNVNMLGSKTEDNGVTLETDDLQYVIADWNEDGITITADLNKVHYLVASANSISLYNDSTTSFEFNTCKQVTAYLTQVKYSYQNEDAYLLKSKFNSDNSYTALTDESSTEYSDTDKTAWGVSSIKAAKDYVWANYNKMLEFSETSAYNGPLANITEEDEASEEETYPCPSTTLLQGYVNFCLPISKIAGQVYSKVEYTIVLCNSTDHGSSRQTVTITQYPSKYVEYGAAGNVFVDGYYAMLNPDSGYSETDLPGGSFLNGSWSLSDSEWEHNDGFSDTDSYASYSFVAANIESDTYYTSTSRDATDETIYSGNSVVSTSGDAAFYEYRPVNTPYEYVQGVKQNNLENDNTIDVHISAFSKHEYNFNVQVSEAIKTYYYRIGDPRKGTPFVCDPRTSTSSYTKAASFLYDYLDHGEKRTVETTTTTNPWSNPFRAPDNGNSGSDYGYGTGSGYGDNSTTTTTTIYYDRYVTSWGDAAQEIKIGAQDKTYDDVIAPIFKVQSAYGALVGWAYFEVAQKRCATYQEAGYPAGRWRLPTLAEITYIVDLQRKNLINTIFATGTRGYWVASGGKVAVPEESTNDYITTYTQDYYALSGNRFAFVRCVYDLWYWGTEPDSEKPTHVYNPKPTKTSSSSSSKRKSKRK